MTKGIKRVSKHDREIIAVLVEKYGRKELRRVLDKTPSRPPGRPPEILSQNYFAIWVAVEHLRRTGLKKTEALKKLEENFKDNTGRTTAWQTLRGYYDNADKQRKADARLSQQLQEIVEIGTDALSRFESDATMIPVLIRAVKSK